VTQVAAGGVPDDAYEEARKHFGEKDLVDLTLAIIAINGWNRLNVAFRTVPGDYKPREPDTRSALGPRARGRS
jgi:alkylhydroperoxidase family enzyme